MRIGDLARMAGTTARAVRHYHRVGVLAEPARTANGYRSYDVADLVRVLRIRWLLAAGLSLQEIAGVLRDGESGLGLEGELVDALRRAQAERARLDRQEGVLRELLRRVRAGQPPSAIDDDLAQALDDVAGAVGGDTALARTERTAVDLLAYSGLADAASQERLTSAYRRLSADPHLVATVRELSARMEALTGLDPRAATEEIEAAAVLLESLLADPEAEQLFGQLAARADSNAPDDGDWSAMLFPEPAHRAVIDLMLARRDS